MLPHRVLGTAYINPTALFPSRRVSEASIYKVDVIDPKDLAIGLGPLATCLAGLLGRLLPSVVKKVTVTVCVHQEIRLSVGDRS